VVQTKDILVRFIDVLSCIDQCFIADSMLEELPTPSRVGKTKVGGIDLNKPRMHYVVEAVIALCLSLSPHGFTASESVLPFPLFPPLFPLPLSGPAKANAGRIKVAATKAQTLPM
jgi:hypothetical protein